MRFFLSWTLAITFMGSSLSSNVTTTTAVATASSAAATTTTSSSSLSSVSTTSGALGPMVSCAKAKDDAAVKKVVSDSETCSGFITWPVKSDLSGSQIEATVTTMYAYARGRYLNTSVIGQPEQASADKFNRENCLMYLNFFNCVKNFPHCKQKDPGKAMCAWVCKEFNTRCQYNTNIPQVKCNDLPDEDCSAAAPMSSPSLWWSGSPSQALVAMVTTALAFMPLASTF